MSAKLAFRGFYSYHFTSASRNAGKLGVLACPVNGRANLSVNSYRRPGKPLDLKDSVVKDSAKARFKEFDLANRVAIVTGGNQGLGLAMAEVLVEAGGHGILSTFLPHCLALTFPKSTAWTAIPSQVNTSWTRRSGHPQTLEDL